MPKVARDDYPNPRDTYEYTSQDGTVRAVLLDAQFWCPTCGEFRPASEVGLRMMDDGTIRNQNNCARHRKSA